MKEKLLYVLIGCIVVLGIVFAFPKVSIDMEETFTIGWIDQDKGRRGIFRHVITGGRELLAEVPIVKYPESLGLEIVGRYKSYLIIRNIGEADCAFENEYDLWSYNLETKQFTDLKNGLSYLGRFSPDRHYYVYGDLVTIPTREGVLPRQESQVLKVLDIEKNIVTTTAQLPEDQTLVAEVLSDPYCEKPELNIVWSSNNVFSYSTYPTEEGLVKCSEDECAIKVERKNLVFEKKVSL